MKKISYILLFPVLALTSCDGFLDRDPVAEIGSNAYFTDESSLLTYTNGFIQKYTPSAANLGYGDGYSDIVVTKQSTTFLTNASWTPDLQTGWSISNWTPIYNINYFLVHMREAEGLSEEVYNHYEGTARFWRAWQYFEKVKTFGAVPWYDTPIDPEDMVALAEALLRDDIAAARALHHKLTPLFRNCFVESNPVPVKAGMAAMGLIENSLRLPLCPASDSTFGLMEQTVKELGLN